MVAYTYVHHMPLEALSIKGATPPWDVFKSCQVMACSPLKLLTTGPLHDWSVSPERRLFPSQEQGFIASWSGGFNHLLEEGRVRAHGTVCPNGFQSLLWFVPMPRKLPVFLSLLAGSVTRDGLLQAGHVQAPDCASAFLDW